MELQLELNCYLSQKVMEQVFISSVTFEDVTEKVDIEAIQLLLEDIDLAPYSDQVKGINFIYIAVTDVTYHPEILEFDNEEQTINIHSQLDYEEVLEADEEETIALMKALFVNQIERFVEMELEFDYEAFEQEIKERFDLLEEEEEESITNEE